jgi:hypothetical protein
VLVDTIPGERLPGVDGSAAAGGPVADNAGVGSGEME